MRPIIYVAFLMFAFISNANIYAVSKPIITTCFDVVNIEHSEKEYPIDELIKAISWVESRYDPNAHNISEDARGHLQIRSVMIEEVNRICKIENNQMRFNHSDAWDSIKSVRMFKIWYEYYEFDKISYEAAARSWNGGPNGPHLNATIKYWDKCLLKFDPNKL